MLTCREQAMLTEGQLYAYERFWMSITDERILREAAVKKSYNKGRTDEAVDIAMKMKQKGMSSDLIAEMTGLSKDVIESL